MTAKKKDADLTEENVRLARWAAIEAEYVLDSARILRQTARDAAECCSKLLKKRGAGELCSLEDLQPGKEHRLGVKARASAHSGELLALLATEIALKGYQILDLPKHDHTHDLWCLFDSLECSTKAELEKRHSSVEPTLREHWSGFGPPRRYLFEKLGKNQPVTIVKPNDILHSVAEEIVQGIGQRTEAALAALAASGR